MVRECVALMLVAFAPGCSLILDFDEALPTDAAIDGISTQSECDYVEPNDTLADAKPISGLDSGPAAICPVPAGSPEDHDFYKFIDLATPTTISISFTSRPGGDLDLKLYTLDGTMIAQSRGFGDGETLVCPGVSPACPMLANVEYVIEVLPGVAGSINSYTFQVTQAQ